MKKGEKEMSKKLKLVLSFCLFIIVSLGFNISADAATEKLYTISSGNTRVYSNSSLSNASGWIYGSDEVTVLEIDRNKKYCKVNYPISGKKTKSGYVAFNSLFTATSGKTYTSRGKITTYRRPKGSKYGYISEGDSVIVIGTSNSYYQVRYPVSGGYKYAFITSTDYEKYIYNRPTYNDVFASKRGKGYSIKEALSSSSKTFTEGDFVYIWGYLHDGRGNSYKSYGSGTCNMTLSIYRPDKTCAYSYTYKNCDCNWIGQKLDTVGTWKIQSKITGAINHVNTQTITVKKTSESKLKLSNASIPGTLNKGDGFTCKGTISSNYKIVKVIVGIWDSNNNVITSYTVNPNAYSYDIKNLDSKIHFSYAKPGTNYYRVWAQDLKKSCYLLNCSYKVVQGNVIVSESEIKNAANRYGISTNSNAYKALKSINSYYSSLKENIKGVNVFLFEGVGNNASTGCRENAMCVVVKKGSIIYVNRNSSTLPDNPFSKKNNGGKAVPTIRNGVYNFITCNHPSSYYGNYAALKIKGANAVRFNNKNDYWRDSGLNSLNVHRKVRNSNTSPNQTWGNSTGCILIGKTNEYLGFAKAVGIINSNSSKVTTYQNYVTGKIVIDRTYAENYLKKIGYSSGAISMLK